MVNHSWWVMSASPHSYQAGLQMPKRAAACLLMHEAAKVSNSRTGPAYYKGEEQTACGAKGCWDYYQQRHRCKPQCCKRPAALGWASQSSWSPHCRSSLAGRPLAPVPSGLLALPWVRACCKCIMLLKCHSADKTGEGFYRFVPAAHIH